MIIEFISRRLGWMTAVRTWRWGGLMSTKPKCGKGTSQQEMKSKSNSEVELTGAANNPTGAKEMR